jgi:hypothetical protein
VILTRRRSFTYPILSDQSNDYIDGSVFDLEVESHVVESASQVQSIVLSYKIRLSNPVLVDALLDKNAQILVEVNCAATWFRMSHCSASLEDEISIPASLLDGAAYISASLVVARDDFEIEFSGLHSEYGRNFRYNFDTGMPLAISSQYSIELEFAEVALRNLIHIRKSVSERHDAFSIDLSSNQIVVNMGINFHAAWGILYANEEQKPLLYISIYKDCVASAVQALASNEEVEEFLWARTFREKIELLNLKIPSDPTDWNACNEIALTLLGEKGVRKIVNSAAQVVGA